MEISPPLILASTSPRRKNLLQRITTNFSVATPDFEEILPPGMAPSAIPRFFALGKAQSVFKKNRDALVIGCDTGVLLNGILLGKPHNTDEAASMLQALSGKTHQVITHVVLFGQKNVHSLETSTNVTFFSLSKEDIAAYLATGEPFDKAGGYGIQGQGSFLVKRIEGDFYGVVGLPIAPLARLLQPFFPLKNCFRGI